MRASNELNFKNIFFLYLKSPVSLTAINMHQPRKSLKKACVLTKSFIIEPQIYATVNKHLTMTLISRQKDFSDFFSEQPLKCVEQIM